MRFAFLLYLFFFIFLLGKKRQGWVNFARATNYEKLSHLLRVSALSRNLRGGKTNAAQVKKKKKNFFRRNEKKNAVIVIIHLKSRGNCDKTIFFCQEITLRDQKRGRTKNTRLKFGLFRELSRLSNGDIYICRTAINFILLDFVDVMQSYNAFSANYFRPIIREKSREKVISENFWIIWII